MTKSFVNVFHGTIDALETDAKSVGLTLTSICRDLGVSRATPDRWRKKVPKTIELMTAMQKVVDDKRAKDAKEAAEGLHHD